MTPFEIAAIFAAGVAAGTINTIVGSGSLVTFPTLLAFGFPPVVANVSNTVGLVPGGFSGVIGYRRELTGQRGRVIRLGVVSVLGAITGGLLLLWQPSAFETVVPVLIVVALLLVVLQPRLNRWIAEHRGERDHTAIIIAGTFLCSVYGGYFGAAQGVIMMGLLGIFVREDLQRLNAVKNVTTTLVNLAAAVLFVFVAHISWSAAGLIALGSILGGQLGARIGRRLSPLALRIVIVAVGLAAIVKLLFFV